MSERSNLLLLIDIQNSIINIIEFTKDITFDIFESDLKTKHAVERNFEIIGEAASRITNDFKLLNAKIEWRILKDFRNFIS